MENLIYLTFIADNMNCAGYKLSGGSEILPSTLAFWCHPVYHPLPLPRSLSALKTGRAEQMAQKVQNLACPWRKGDSLFHSLSENPIRQPGSQHYISTQEGPLKVIWLNLMGSSF